MSGRAMFNRAPAGPLEILGDVRNASELARDVDEFADVVGLIRPDCPSSPRRAFPLRVQQQQPGFSLGAAVGLRGHRVDDQAMAVLDQQVPQIRQPRFGTLGLPLQFRVRVGLGRMRVIGPALPVNVWRLSRELLGLDHRQPDPYSFERLRPRS
jgi:hypothetical protein